MAAAVPLIAVVAGGITSAALGGGILGAVAAVGTAYVVSSIGKTVFPTKTASSSTYASSDSSLATQAATRQQSFRQAITEHQIVFGRVKLGGPIVFIHSRTDDAGREDGFFYVVVVLAAHSVRAIGTVYLGDTPETDSRFAGLVRIDRHLGAADQPANTNLVAETDGKWTAEHRGRGRAYLVARLKITAEAFPSGPPNLSAIVEGNDQIYDPRDGSTGYSTNAALCLAWYLTASCGWRASWSDIDIPALIAAANVCDEGVRTLDGAGERRYTVNGTFSLSEGKIAITQKLVSAMAGALVVSGGRFFIHAGGPGLPVGTLTSDDLRGDVTLQGSRAMRDLFNGVRATYVEPAANWQTTDAPPLLASNYVAEDGGERFYEDLEFPLTTSATTVQRLMKVALEANRRQRTVSFPAKYSALCFRPWDVVTVALDRLAPFPARITGWTLSADGGVDLTLQEEDEAVWAWDPDTDERATGDNPSVVLPNPGRIAAPAS
ncbi:phage tail protein, partial [Roseomonas sp. GC11]|uniref:phage tail protein n=1 Tax=Roseomonas sp. GC11 TaxID=2950546 RepID=UPI00210BC236